MPTRECDPENKTNSSISAIFSLAHCQFLFYPPAGLNSEVLWSNPRRPAELSLLRFTGTSSVGIRFSDPFISGEGTQLTGLSLFPPFFHFSNEPSPCGRRLSTRSLALSDRHSLPRDVLLPPSRLFLPTPASVDRPWPWPTDHRHAIFAFERQPGFVLLRSHRWTTNKIPRGTAWPWPGSTSGPSPTAACHAKHCSARCWNKKRPATNCPLFLPRPRPNPN